MTVCDGEVIYQDGKFTKVGKTVALKALHDDLSKALADDEAARRKLSVALLLYARRFYENYIDTSKHQPFYSAELDGLVDARGPKESRRSESDVARMDFQRAVAERMIGTFAVKTGS